jgi:hypothetical protein
MKTRILILLCSITLAISCKDDINIFDKSADERAAAAIADLKSSLVAPSNGWRLKYRPEATSGSFYMLLKFNDDNTVNIKSDLGSNDGEFYDQNVTYRIDNSLGLELIIENYSFFSFLFEQNQASFGAEFEFIYVNKTPDNALVFRSKTDRDVPTILTFVEAGSTDESYLGIDVSKNLNIMASDISRFSSAYKMVYTNKDLILYLSLDTFTRTLEIGTASKKSNTASTKLIEFSTPYVIRGDSISFDQAFKSTVLGNVISLKGIKLNNLTDTELNVCTNPIPVHAYAGVTSAGDPVSFETTLVDETGKTFSTVSDFYSSPVGYVFDNGVSQGEQIVNDIAGAAAIQLYYNFQLNDGSVLFAIGFVTANADGSTSFILKEFTPVLNENNIVFNFSPGFSIFGNSTPDADLTKIEAYLDTLAEGDHTYVFKYTDDIYEFFNPCNGWSFVFVNGNR